MKTNNPEHAGRPHDAPPQFDSGTRAGLSRFASYALLMIVVLATGILFPAPQSFAQDDPKDGGGSALQAMSQSFSVDLTWSGLSNPNDKDSTVSYEVRWKLSIAADWGPWTAISGSDETTTSHTVRRLSNDLEYNFQVRKKTDGVAGSAIGPASATPVFKTPSPAEQRHPTNVPGGIAWRAQSWSWTVNTGSLVASATSQTVSFSYTHSFNRARVRNYDVLACPWTSVTVNNRGARPAGCATVVDGSTLSVPTSLPASSPHTFSGSLSPTQTMIDNGGVVFVMYHETASMQERQVVYTKWVGMNEGASITGTAPATLGEGNLNGARVTVDLTGSTFNAGVATGNFRLSGVPARATVTVSSVARSASDTDMATLTLSFTGDFDSDFSLGVTVLGAGHAGTADLETGTVLVAAVAEASAAAPTELSATAENRRVALTWRNPGDAAITGYEVSHRLSSAQGWGAWTAVPGSGAATTSHTVTGLANDSGYDFRIRALKSKADPSAASATASATPAAPAASITSTSPVSLTEENIHNATVTVTLARSTYAAAADLDKSDFELASAPSGVTISGVARDSDTAATVTLSSTGDFDSAAKLSVRVKGSGHTESGAALTTGEVDVAATAEASAAKPTNLTATPGNRQVALRWTDPSDSAITGYEVNRKLSSAQSWGTWTAIPGSGATTTSHTVTGLANNQAYDFRIRALKSKAAPSAESDTASATPSARGATITATTPSPLTEANLNGARLTVTLRGGVVYDTPLAAGDFGLSGMPSGVTTLRIHRVRRNSDTGAYVWLRYDGENFDADFNLGVTVKGGGLDGGGTDLPVARVGVSYEDERTGLSDLSLSSGTLNPTFVSTTTEYSAVVPLDTASVTVTPTVKVNTSTVTVNGGSSADAVSLVRGENTITVVVTASGGQRRTYTVAVRRGSVDAGLIGLEVLGITGTSGQGHVSQARRAMPLSPAFSSLTRTYSVAVPETVKRIRIRPTANRPSAATITVGGEGATSGRMGGLIDLSAVGTGKAINVVVTPRDTSLSARTYVVTVTREAATITPSAASVDATPGTAITDVTFTAGGAGFSPTGWSVDPALPQGLSMDSGTGTISGTPRRATGAAAVTYTVTGTGGLSVSAFGEQLVHSASAEVSIKVDTAVSDAGVEFSSGTAVTGGKRGLTVNEGSSAVYSIALTKAPQGGNVTVTPAVSGSADVTFSPASREFTSQNYASAQSFTVTAGADGDAVDDAAVISHTATGGGYDGAAIDDVTVTVDDDEELGLEITTGTVVTDGSHGLSVNEGSNKVYSVALGSEPGSSVTVTPVVPPGTDVSVDPGSLEFDSTNWETARDFTVSAREDDDTADDTVKIRHSMSSDDSDYDGKSGPVVTVTVDDNDDFGVTLGITPATDGTYGLSVNEDSTASYTMKLDAEPTGDVTIRPTAGQSASISVETKFLSFTVNNWNVAQSVTVKAADDGNASDESVEITHSISGGGYGSVAVPAVTVTAVDDDRSSDNDLKALAISSVTLSPAFSRAATTYTASVPNSVSRVTVAAVANDGAAEISITPADADANTRGHQVDLDTANVNNITVRVTAQTGGVKNYTVAVTRAKSTTPASFSFTDATGAEPGAEVTSDAIEVDVEDTGAAIPISVTSGGTLVVDGTDFTGNTVSDGQRVAVKVTASSDFSATRSATVTIGGVSDEFSVTTRAASGNANLSSIGLSSGTLDPAVSAERTSYTVRVGSGVNRIKVTPNTAHAGARAKVSGGHVRSSYAASGTESGDIWFPPRRFNRFAILVTVRAEDGTEKRYTLRVSRQGRNAHLNGLVVAAGGGELTLGRSSGGSTVAGFAGRTTAYTVRVPQATTGVEVTPTTTDSRATVTVNGAAVTRDANGKLGAATVNLPGPSTTVSVVVTPEDTGAPKQTYTVTVEKTERRVTVAPVSLVVSEGSTATYTVSLEGAPTGPVTVTPASGNTGAATVSGALEFTTQNWNTPQTVTVTGVDDRKSNPPSGRGTAVTHTVTGGGYTGAAAATVRVKVTDEAASIAFTNPASLSEDNLDGAVATVDVSGGLAFSSGVDENDFELTGVPRGISVSISEASRDGSNHSRAALTLSYNGADFDSDFSLGVTAKAGGHSGARDLATETVRVSAVVEPPTLSGLEVLGVRGTLSRGVVTESRSALAASPAFSGETTSYAVTVPATMEHVRILPTAREPWNVTITVDGTAWGSGNLTGRIKLSAVGTGKRINVVVTPKDPGLSATAYTYVVTVTREAATITPSATSVDARAGTAVTAVTFTSGGAGFSPTSWVVDPALPQGLSMDSGTGRISGTPGRASSAADYTVTATGESSLTVLGVERIHRASATVRIKVDPEVLLAGAAISPGTSLTVNEGSFADYTMALSAQPTGDVTVRLSASGSGDVSIDKSSLTFTRQNYASAQSVRVTAGADGDAVDDVAVISHAATGGGYDGVAIESVTVTVDDDEELGLSVTGTTVTGGSHGLVVTEGSTNTYSVALGSEPGSSVTVTPVLAPGTDVSVTPGSLEFDSANWETAKSFTVEAGEDDDTTDDTVRIRHSMSSDDSYYDGKSGPVVTVTVDDDDGFGVTLGITPAADGTYGLSVNEDSTASYTIKLDAEPTGDVTIRPTAGESTSISVETKSLSFTVNNWSVAQSVKVKAAADGNASDESVEITHSISGGGYGSVAVPAVKVTAVDDDKSSDNDLKALAISSVTLSPAFGRTRTTYAASVPNSVSRVTVVAVANDGTAEISITPADADANTRGHQVDLETTAVNTITVKVTAQTGAEKDYAVAVTRAKSATPAGFSFTDATGAEPGAEVTSDAIEVDVETGSPAISVTSGGTLVVDGSVFTGNTVSDGQRVAVRLTASSEFSATRSATVTIGGVSDEFSVTTRAASGNANLSSIGLSSGTLGQAVSADRTTYTIRVAGGVNKVKVTPNTANAGARVKVNSGSYAASGTESPDIYLPFRSSWLRAFRIRVYVRAEDGTEKRYTFQVARQSIDAHLNGLVVAAGGGELTLGRSSGGSTVAGFHSRTTAYTVRVSQATTSVEVTPTTSDRRATVTVNGSAVTRDANGKLGTTTVNLPGTSTTVSVVVTPEDTGATTETYTVTVEKTSRRVRVEPVSLVVGEGSSATYSVRLEGQPTGTVTVTPSSGNAAVATVSGAFTFNAGNWNRARTVTVRGVDDQKANPASGRRTTVTHTVTGGGYDGVAAPTVSVRVTDEAALIQSTSPAPLTEENLDGATITVDLAGGLDFKPGVDKDDFELSGFPSGISVSVQSASRDGSDDSRAALTLSYDATDAANDFDSDFSMRVTAKAAGHTGSSDLVTSPVSVTATDETPAARPTGLSARGAPQSAVLTWTDPTDSAITGYQVSRKLSTAQSWEAWATISGSDSSTVTHTVTSLTNSTSYDFRIRALVFKAAASAASASASATPEAEGAAIQSTSPTSLSEANLNGATVTVDLAGGLDFNGDADKDDFELSGLPSGVTVSISGASRDATSHYRAALTLSYDATSAANDFDSSFNLVVTAEAAGHTGSSNLSTGTVEVTATAETAAAKPANLRAAVGNAQVVLTWDNPSDSTITGYEYQQRDGANWPTGWTTMAGSGAATTTYTATGLTNGTAYHFRIRALKFKADASAASDSASATPAAQSASIQSTSPTPLTEANLDGATVTVDLAGGLNFNSDADKDDFELTGLPGGTTVSISTASRDGSNQARAALTLSYDAADAENDFDSDFNLGVKAKASGHTGASDLGTGTVAVTATAEAAAAKPTGLSAREGPRSAVLTWTNPSDTLITGYEYQQRDGANWPAAWTAISGSNAATTTYTVTGLDNGTAYDFRIRALRFKAPESAASDAASATPAALGASIQSTSPASLTEANLDGATVTVDLAGGLDFSSGVTKDDFELTGVPSGITLSVSAASRDATNHYRAALTLSYSGDFGVSFNLGVRAGAGGHTGSSDLLTGTVAVAATMGVTVSPTSLTIAESGTGNSAKYTVKLDSRPSGQVTITPSAAANVAVTTADPDDKLRFTAQNWNAEQEVTVTAEDDDVDNANDRTATVSHTVEGADYGSVTASDVSVTLTDDDTVGVSVSESSVSVNEEGGGADYTVVLTSKPSADVTVTISSGDSTAVQVAKAGGNADGNISLTFTPSGAGIWSAPQTVTVTAPNDADTASETVTLTQSVASGSASEYSSENVENVTVNVTDNDIANLLVSRATDLSLSEGSSSDYSVRLSVQPASSNVVVEISSNSPAVTVQSGSAAAAQSVRLTFTQSGASIWSAAQTVTVAAVPDPDSEDEIVTITHSVVDEDSDDGYDGVSDRTFAVNVDDTTPEAPPIAETPEDPGAGEDPATGDLPVLSVSGGGEVVEGDSATTAQAAFTVSLSPAASLEVSVSYATADGTAEAGSDYESASGTLTFSPGETTRTVSVTVNGDDEAEADETFTLTLASSPNGSIDPQNSSAQAVIANDDRKTVDAGMSGEFSVGETTVTVESSLPEDTGLEVVLPPELESGGSDIEELTVTLAPTDAQIDAERFGYTGNGQDHVLVDIDVSPVPDAAVRVCLPITDGLRGAAGRQRLYIIRFSNGEWEELSSETEDAAVCADVSGFSPFALVFQIDHAKRRVGNVNRAILPELARAVTASTLEAITSRMEDAKAGGGTANALNAQAPPEPEPGHQKPQLRLGELENGETLSLTEAVDGSYYSVSLAGGYDAPPGESEAEPAPAPRSGGLGMWISGDYRSLSGKGGGLADWNGRLISGHLGADYRFGRSFLAGVATSWSHGSFDYSGGGEGSTRVSGDYASRMNSFHPYLGIFLSERLDLWASAGWGFGEIRMDDGEIPSRQKASARLGTLATGADLALLGGGASSLSLKGEAWISRVKLKGNGDRIEGIRVNANRLRAALQGSHALSLGSGSSLVPSLEFGIRRDGGDGETGVGGELAGGLSLASSFGLTLEARGRALLFHQGDAREWGVGGSVRFDPGGDGRGLSMSVIPSWGDGSSGVQGLWDAETAADLGTSASTRNFGLETEVGYGFPALGDRGLLTPYGAFGRPDPDSRNYRLGSRFSLNRALDLTLEGQRREIRAGDPEHELTVQGRLNW